MNAGVIDASDVPVRLGGGSDRIREGFCSAPNFGILDQRARDVMV